MHDVRILSLTEKSCTLPGLYFDSFSHPAALIVSRAGDIVKFIYLLNCLLSQSQTLFEKLQASSSNALNTSTK